MSGLGFLNSIGDVESLPVFEVSRVTLSKLDGGRS